MGGLRFKTTRQAEAAPINYVAELISTDTDSERAIIRRLIALMVSCCDPLAISIDGRSFGTAIDHRLKPRLIRTSCDRCRGDAIKGHSGTGPVTDPCAATKTSA